jgi:DNA-binding transcriptional MerR regulator
MTAPGSSPAAARAAAAVPGVRGDALMSIGEVLDQLRGEFPDITISKLRFLEAEGLVEPERTPAGYRKYSWPDVTRLRVILAAQRDHYLPLRVIREQLAALDRGEPTAAVVRAVLAAGDGRVEAAPAPVTGLSARRPTLRDVDEPVPAGITVRHSREQLLERSGLTDATLTTLERQGLLSPQGGSYDEDALVVARVVAQLAGYGIEPRHLRGYQAAADREIGLLTQLVAPLARQNTPAARDRAAQTVREVAALSEQLHAALLRVGLRTTLGG